MQAARVSIDGGLNLGLFLVIGFPKDTEEDFDRTVELAREMGRLGLSDVSCAYFFPIPSTALGNDLLESGRLSLNTDFLMTPLFVHDKWINDEHNYCESVSSRRLTFYKYRIVSAFYFSLWRHHPTRIWQSLKSLASGEEASKLDVFLNETKRRWLRVLGVDSSPKEALGR